MQRKAKIVTSRMLPYANECNPQNLHLRALAGRTYQGVIKESGVGGISMGFHGDPNEMGTLSICMQDTPLPVDLRKITMWHAKGEKLYIQMSTWIGRGTGAENIVLFSNPSHKSFVTKAEIVCTKVSKRLSTLRRYQKFSISDV